MPKKTCKSDDKVEIKLDLDDATFKKVNEVCKLTKLDMSTVITVILGLYCVDSKAAKNTKK